MFHLANVPLIRGSTYRDVTVIRKPSGSYHLNPYRILAEKEAEKKLKIKYESLSAASPYGILHFYEKKVKFQSGDVEERLIICLQQMASELQGRFLGAPQLPVGTGAAQCVALVRYMKMELKTS